MNQLCAATKCSRTARGLCDCCTRSLCLQHLTQHNALLIAQLNPLADELNLLRDRLQTVNTGPNIDESRRQLEQWREKCYKRIDRFYEEKCRELDRLATKNGDREHVLFRQLQSRVSALMQEQESTREEIDSLSANLAELRGRIEKIVQTNWHINTRCIVIDEACVVIEEKNDKELDFASLSPARKRITLPGGSYLSLASNDRYLLMHNEPYLRLVNREMNTVREVNWSHGVIWDMCWLPMLERFIVLDHNSAFLVDEHSLTIERVGTSETRQWLSCTSSENSLYLSTKEYGSSILQFQVTPTVQLVQEWTHPLTCAEDEIIHDHEYKNGTFGLIIMNSLSNAIRFDLKSAERWNCLWSLPLDLQWRQQEAFRCCAIMRGAWVIADYDQGRLLHITKDGRMKTVVDYQDSPRRVALLGPDILAILTTRKVNFHKLRNDCDMY